MVSIRPFISNSSSLCINPLIAVPSVPITIRITVSFIIIFFLLESLLRQRKLIVFYWSLNDGNSPQVSQTLLSILANLNNDVVWTVFTHPVISKYLNQSFGDCIKSTNYNWYNRHFHIPQFFNSLARYWYLSLFLFSFDFNLWSAKSLILQILSSFFFFCFLIIIRSGRLAEIRWRRFYLKIPEEFVGLIPHDRCCVVHIPFVCMVKILVQFPGDHLAHPVVPSLIFFLGNFFYIHLLCDWLFCLSPHNFYLHFCCNLSILALLWLVLMALFCAAIRKDSVSLLKFPFLSHVHFFLEWDVASYSLKKSIELFSHFCFLIIIIIIIPVFHTSVSQ